MCHAHGLSLLRTAADHGGGGVAAAAVFEQLGGQLGGADRAHIHYQRLPPLRERLPIQGFAVGLHMAGYKHRRLRVIAVRERNAA